jgi:hypothetical protein
LSGDGKPRAITGFLSRLGSSRPAEARAEPAPVPVSRDESLYPTKAIGKFLGILRNQTSPVLLDLGPVVGHNITFLGDLLACKIHVEDLYSDLDRHARAGTLREFPAFLKQKFPYGDAAIDGVLCWDLLDYLDMPSAQVLARELARILKRGAPLLGFFGTTATRQSGYTKYVIVDDHTLQYRPCASALSPQRVLVNRDIIRLFEGLRVSDSFLLKASVREILFRKAE